jgi:dihydroxyacetone kinase
VGREVRRAALAAADALDAAEPKLTAPDSVAGGGDLGASMKRAAQAIHRCRRNRSQAAHPD